MRLTIYNIQHSDFGIYKCVGRFEAFPPFFRFRNCRADPRRDAWQIFNFWHHLIFITFNIFLVDRSEKSARRNRVLDTALLWVLFDDEAAFSCDGWPEFRALWGDLLSLLAGHPAIKKLCCPFPAKKWQTFFTFFSLWLEASQPPTTIPPPTTEAVETTSVKKVVNYLPPVGQTTMYTVHMIDKGRKSARKREEISTPRRDEKEKI